MVKKTFFGLIIIIGIVFAYVYLNRDTSSDTNWSTLNLIKGRMNGRLELVDYDDTISVDSVDDIGFQVKDKKILIYFGKLSFKIGKADLENLDFMKAMKSIGLEIKKNKSGQYYVTYWGEEVARWAN